MELDLAPVTVLIAADPGLIRLIRLVASSCASDLGYRFHELEDIRIAVDECATCAIAMASPDASVRSSFFLSPPGLVVFIEVATTEPDGTVDLDPLADQIVGALSESFTLEVAHGRLRIELRFPPPES